MFEEAMEKLVRRVLKTCQRFIFDQFHFKVLVISQFLTNAKIYVIDSLEFWEFFESDQNSCSKKRDLALAVI